jgi:hypothetical protein
MLSHQADRLLSHLISVPDRPSKPFSHHRHKASLQSRKRSKKAKSEREMLSTVKKCQNLALCNNSGCNVVV